MATLSAHYAASLGSDDSWRVESAELRCEERRVEIRLTHNGLGVCRPEHGGSCGLAHHADERRWRHLGTTRLTREAVARVPRSRCAEHGVKTVVPPWGGKHCRFTVLVTAVGNQVRQARRAVSAAATLLGLDWDACNPSWIGLSQAAWSGARQLPSRPAASTRRAPEGATTT